MLITCTDINTDTAMRCNEGYMFSYKCNFPSHQRIPGCALQGPASRPRSGRRLLSCSWNLELGKLGTWKAWKPAVKAGGESPIVGWKFWKMGIFIRGRRSLALELEEANIDQRHSSSLCCLGDFWLLSKL